MGNYMKKDFFEPYRVFFGFVTEQGETDESF